MRCILSINANVIRKREIEIFEGVDICEDEGKKESKVVVYFVQSGDSLWDIAKRYRVPCSAVCEFNDMADDRVKCGMRLLFPGMCGL